MSKLVLNRDGGSADQYGHLLALSRSFNGEVIEGFKVVANSSPDMNVRVQAGSARIPTGTPPSNYHYYVAIDTASPGEQVAITTANGSNPRIDLIVAYVDVSVTPSSGTPNNVNNMLKLAAVAGTPAASPVAPNGAAIQSAIGASNPYIIIGQILVGTAVSSITNANITDVRSLIYPRAPGGHKDLDLYDLQTIRKDTTGNFVATGAVLSFTASTLNFAVSAGRVYINGKPLAYAGGSGSVVASKDTYFDLLDNGDGTASLVYTGANSVANGAASPTLAANSIRIGKAISGASAITSIVTSGIDSLGNYFAPNTPSLGYNGQWIAPSLQNSWVNYGAPYDTCQYMKDAQGFVHIKGFIKNGTVTAATNLFTLPAGFRPAASSYYPVVLSTGAAGSIEVKADGTVNSVAMTATYTAFGHIVFKADA